MSKDFLGKGISLDFGLDSYGMIKMSSYERSVEESIEIILGTKCGERVYNEAFGCQVHELLFEPNDARTHILAKNYVQEALERFEPRINLLEVTVLSDGNASLSIDVSYEIRNTNSQYNLVYPFYLLPQ
jgi:phage baseplate assembly protein W